MPIETLHDWHATDIDDGAFGFVAVGPTEGYRTPSHKTAAAAWMHDLRRDDAQATARAMTSLAWHVETTVMRRPPLGPAPDAMQTALSGDRGETPFPRPGLVLNWRRGNWQPSDDLQEEVDRAAKAILWAAAARAALPPPGSIVNLAYGRNMAFVDQTLSVAVEMSTPDDEMVYVQAKGSLRDAIAALSVAQGLCPPRAKDSAPAIAIPESATLRASLTTNIARKASASAQEAAAFLRLVGLGDVARTFLADHGGAS